MTSAFIEWVVVRNQQVYRETALDFQAHPELPLDYDDDYQTWFMYGASIYLHFLRDRYFGGDVHFVSEMWRRMRNPPGSVNDATYNEPDFVTVSYPVKAMNAVEREGLIGHRLLMDDGDAAYAELGWGAKQKVFIDDRYDMFPEKVIYDFFDLSAGRRDWAKILARYDVEVVVWPKGESLAQLMERSGDWTVIHRIRRAHRDGVQRPIRGTSVIGRSPRSRPASFPRRRDCAGHTVPDGRCPGVLR